MKNYKPKLGFIQSENNNEFDIDENNIEKLDYENYRIINRSVGGDNPKNVIKVKYSTENKRNKWITYIAKTSGKWYPNESITEFLIYKIGIILGLNLAVSKIVIAEKQLRFLSQYFLKEGQQLSHGKELYANSEYFSDIDTVQEIENEKKSREHFTLQITKKVIKGAFPTNGQNIFNDFIKMLIFDAYVGNNDRHYENWAIVSHIENKHLPYFSPIYDTARGLFWNESEVKLKAKFYPLDDKKFINYAENSKPKIGWENENNINHFRIFELINESEYGITKKEINNFLSTDLLIKINSMINIDFKGIISKERAEVIKSYLNYRRKKLFNLIK